MGKFVVQIITVFVVYTTVAQAEEASPKNLPQIARAVDAFGFRLLHQLELEERSQRGNNGGEPKNILISPFSLSTVLTMAMAGAQGNTYEEMKSVLGFQNTKMCETELITAYRTLFQSLNSSNCGILQIVNAVAIENSFSILPSYLDVVEEDFQSELFSINISEKSDEATWEINQWSSEQTGEKIAKLLKEDLDKTTRMVLLNALKFKNNWAKPFNLTKSTEDEDFTYEDGLNGKKVVVVKVPMMHRTKSDIRYATVAEVGQLVELPYEGEQQSMFLFLPDEEKISNDSTMSDAFNRALNQPELLPLSTKNIDLTLPCFKIESSFELTSPLQSMGVKAAFKSNKADFSRMTGAKELFVSNVLHKTVIEVNEAGSEAAAVSSVELTLSKGKSRKIPLLVHFNRPFLFAIRDNRLQLTLFAGIVNKPEGGKESKADQSEYMKFLVSSYRNKTLSNEL